MKKKILALIWKELLMVLRDNKVRISILVPPIFQLCIFTFAATLDVQNAPIGILNRDSGEKGFELVQRFYGSKIFNYKITHLQSVEQIGPFIDEQKGLMVLSLDQQFSRDLDAGKMAKLQLIFDGRKSNTAQIVSGYVTELVKQFNEDTAANGLVKMQNVELAQRTWFNPNRLYFWYNLPCLVAILSMMTCLVVTTQSVARERELGTFDQLLISPLLPIEILIGKILPGIIIGVLEGLFMIAIGTIFLGVPFTGSLVLYFISLVVFVTSISGIGLFISSLSTTQQQAMLGTFGFMLPSVLLAGYATPIENMPDWLQPVTYAVPLRYMLIISKGIFLKAMPARIVFQNIWPLLVISVINIVGAGLFFRRRLQ
ncbi:MAG: ABC transporter permease [Simkaniaceae bacterium]|nr:ABC transporter permease [Simkaniaceae bacterium]